MDNPPPIQPQPIDDGTGGITPRPQRTTFPVWRVLIGVVGVVVVGIIAAAVLYVQALRPVDGNDAAKHTVEIVSGMMPSEIARHLKESDVIRSQMAFDIHTRLAGVRNQLQAGTYELTKQMSTQQVVDMLVNGSINEEFEVTFLPGATLADGREALVKAGFDETEVDAALSATYDHPLFASRPATADLEGYLFGETHRFTRGTSVNTVLHRFFDDFYAVIEREGLVAKYKAQGLSLYEGITLASIIQKEVSGDGDSKQVAQVFYKRLADGISLGADATFVYAATKAGETPRVNYPSPYNTRIHTGLPPGPISTPGVEALVATAAPAAGDYLYFVSGDDGTNYFSRTEQEHIRNTRQYCQKNCALF